MHLRIFRLIGLFAFMAFVAMAPPASAGVSFGIDNADTAYSVEYNDYIQLTDNGFMTTEEQWIGGGSEDIKDGCGHGAGYHQNALPITSAWKGGGGFGSMGIASL